MRNNLPGNVKLVLLILHAGSPHSCRPIAIECETELPHSAQRSEINIFDLASENHTMNGHTKSLAAILTTSLRICLSSRSK